MVLSWTISPFISSKRCGMVPARPSNSSSPVSPYRADEFVAAGVGDQPANQCDCGPIVVSEAACKTLPATCSGRSRVRGRRAQAFSSCFALTPSRPRCRAERLGGGDDADQPAQIVAVRGEIVGQQHQRRVAAPRLRQVVHRLDQRPAEQQRPDAVDRGAGEVGVSRVGDPARQPLARAAGPGPASARRGTARGARPPAILPSCGRAAGIRSRAVADAGEAEWACAEESGQAAEIGPASRAGRDGCGTGRIEPHAEERPGHPARQPFGRRAACLLGSIGHGEEIGRRLVGPQPVIGDQVADDRVIRPVLRASRR